jgi:hypothetical protein
MCAIKKERQHIFHICTPTPVYHVLYILLLSRHYSSNYINCDICKYVNQENSEHSTLCAFVLTEGTEIL